MKYIRNRVHQWRIKSKMEATVDKLEAMFQKTESDLDFISRKLDAEFANENPDGKNPAHLLQKVSEIKSEYSTIVEEAKAIQEAQKDAMKFFQGELMTMCEALTKLQTSAGKESEKAEELSELESILGIPSSLAGASSVAGASTSAQCPTTPKEQTGDEYMQAENTPQEEEEEAVSLSPYDRRVNSSELIPIDDVEFNSVSSLVRGRVKLTEVNQTYRILYQHFKEEENSDALTNSEMYKMGLRVTGQTGEAKLKVLRSLKLLEIGKNGIVKLL